MMVKFTRLFLGCVVALVFRVGVKAQLSGTYNIPLNYPTLAAAISALNTQGVNGPVFIELNAGYTETAPAGGYGLTATGTALNPITFRKTGVGANPLISANTGGSGTPASAVQDGIWRLIGSDYITIDGIDLNDPNAANPATMEYGYGLFKANTSDGCQNNTIKNCVISLRVINNATGSGPSADGSRGINVSNALPISQTSQVTPVSFAGTNSNNKFYSNTIKNCNIGIALMGYAAPSPFTLADTGNDIGGSSSSTGNTILNFGGAAAATNPAAGVRTLAQYDLNVAYNIFDNNDGTGTNHVNALRGIYVNTAVSANVSITNNTITLKGASTTAQVAAVENVAGATAANNTVSINNNLISNCSNAVNTSGSFLGIYNNAASPSYLEIRNNRFTGINTIASTGSNYLIYNTGPVLNAITISNNQITNCTNAASTSGAYYMIFNNVVSSAVLDISNNTLDNNSTSASTGATHLIYNASATSNSISLSSNTITNCNHTVTSSGAFYAIYNNGASPVSLEIRSNTFANNRINAFSGATHLVYNTAAIANSINLSNNLFSTCTSSITSTGSFYGIYNNAASSTSLNLSNNTFTADVFSATSGSVHCIFNRGAATNTFITGTLNNNLITGCSFSASSNAPFLGIYNNGVTSGSLSLSNNTVTGMTWSSATSVKYLLYNTGSVSNVLDLNNNLVANCNISNNTTGTFNGINNAGTCTVALNICGNTFTNTGNVATTGGAYLMLNAGAVPGGAITITNNAVGGFTNVATGLGDFFGISNSGTSFSSLQVSSNVYNSNSINVATGTGNLIYNTGAVSTTINNINLSNNLVTNCTSSVSSTGSFFGIYNNASSCVNLSMNTNTFTGNALYAVSGANHLMYNRGAITNTFSTVNINGNLISGCTHSSSAGAGFYSIWNNGVTSTVTSISSNTITASSWESATALRYLISNWGPAINSSAISNNLISNCTHTNNTTGTLFGIYNNNNTAVSSGPLLISNNTFTNISSTATSGDTHFIHNGGIATNTFTSVDMINNLLANCASTVNGTGSLYGLYNNTASAFSLNISKNTFTNAALTSSTGSTYFIHNRGAAGSLFASVTASNNLLSGLTHSNNATGVLYGIINAGVATSTCGQLSMVSNTIMNSVSSGTGGQINLLYNTCPVTTSIGITNNLITSFTNSISTTGAFFAVSNVGNSSGGDLSVTNNVFSNLVSTASSASRYLIYNSGAVTNSISFTDNLVTNCSHSISGTGSYHGIYNNGNGSAVSANLSNNTFTNNSSSAVSGNVYMILNSGVSTNTIATVSVLNNSIGNYTNNATSGNFYGLFNSGYTALNLNIATNTLSAITLSSTGTAQQLIANNGRITNTISIRDNLLSGFTNTTNTLGSFYGIVNSANFANSNFPSDLIITNNRFLNNTINATTGSVFFINNTGITTNTIGSFVVSNNLVSAISSSMSGNSNWYGIYNTAISCGSLSVVNNTIANIVATTTSTTRYMIFNGGVTVNNADISNNRVSNFTSTVNTVGSYYGVNNSGNSLGDVRISNNTFLGLDLSASSGSAFPVYNQGIVTNSVILSNNLVSNVSHSASSNGGFIGVYNNAGSSAGLIIAANTLTNMFVSSSTGSLLVLYNRGAGSSTISAMTITNNAAGSCTYISTGGQFYGFFNNGSSFGNLSVGSNTFQNVICTTTTAPRYYIYNTGAGTAASISNNLMSGFTSILNSTGSYYGINNGGALQADLSVTNNVFLNQNLSATTGSAFVIYNSGAVNNTVTMAGNWISGFTYSAGTTGGFLGICNSAASSAGLSITTNTLANISLSTSAGPTHYIYNRGVASSTIATLTMSSNVLGPLTYFTSSGPWYGLYNNATSFSSLNIGGNSFSNVASTSTTSPRYFIYNTGAGSALISILSNTISNYTASGNTTGLFHNVLNTGASAGDLTINGNSFNNEILPSTTGAAYSIYNTGAVTGSVTISNNLTSNLSHSSTTGALYGYYNGGAACSNAGIVSNTLSNVSTTNSVSVKYLVYNTSAASNNISLNNNVLSNYSAPLNTTGNFIGIYNTGHSQGSFSASNNTISTIILPATTGTCYMIYNTGTVSSSADLNNNLVAGLTNSSSAAGTFYGIYHLSPVSPSSLSISGNTFSNSSVNVPTVSVYLVYHSGTSTTSVNSINLNNNSVRGFTNTLGSGTFYGVFNNAIPSSNLSLSGNSFLNCVSVTTNSPRYMVYNTGSVTSSMRFNNNLISGYTSSLNTAANFYGVYNPAFCGGTLDMSGNTFTNNFLESTTAVNYLVCNTGTASGNISMNSNTIAGNTNSTTTSGDFYGVYNAGATTADLSMNGNTFGNNSSAATTANTYLIYNTGTISNSISISNNNLAQAFTNSSIDYSGTLYSIYNTGGTSTSTLNISSNSFSGYSYSGLPGSGTLYFIYNTNDNKRFDVTGNTWNSLSLKHNGHEYLIYNPSSTSVELNVNNNTVSGYTRTANAASLFMYYANGNSPATCSQVFSGNNFTSISAGTQGTGSFYGIYNTEGSGSAYPKKQVFNNSISNVNYNGLAFFYGYYFDLLGDDGSTGSSVYSNTLSGISWGGPLYGFYIGGNVSSGFAANVYSNTVLNLNASATAADVYGAYLAAGGKGLNFYKNKISDLSANGLSGTVDGIKVAASVNTSIYNNVIGNLNTPSSNVVNPLNGINISGGTKVNVYYNTVNLNAVSTGSAFGANALLASSSVTLDLRNNILVNTSIPTGTASTAAYRRSSSSLANYLSSSNNNLFYAGIPAPNRLIFADGTNASQILPAYQLLVSPRDNNSISENPPFLSTVGTNAGFLHINTGIPSLTESGALNIAGITDDVDGQVRQGNAGYTGSGSAPDIGADEYDRNLIPCSSANAGLVTVPASPIKCEGEAVYMLSTGATAAGSITHQWKVSSTSGGPYVNATGGNGANYTAYMTPTLSAGTYYYVMVTTCAIGPVVGISNEVTVTVNAGPTASASVLNPTICAGETLSFSGNSNIGINYNWQGPNNFTATAQNPTITGAVTNASGTYTLRVSDANCTSVPALVNVTVHPTPPSFTLTPDVSSICIGSSQTITASIPITSPTLNFGSQAHQNTASGYPAPYSVYYGGQKMQILILAGELAAAGFTAGTPIQSVQFPVVSLGANWGSTLHECQNFMVGIKATTVNLLSVFETGLSNVVPPANYTPVVGYNNIHAFTSPFIWDGSSNLVLETVFSNSIIGTAGNTVIQYNSPTGFQSTLVYRADNQNVSAIAAATGSNINVGFVRPDFKLNGVQVGTYSWSPSTGLSATTGASVVANPAASGIYSVTLSNALCASSSTANLSVILMPTISISASSSTVCIGNTATLTATGATTYTWSTGIKNPSIVVSPFTSITYTVNGSNPVCPSSSSTIFIASAPALSLNVNASPGVLCQGGSSTLSVSGASTYTWTGGSNATSIVVSPASNTNYSVTGYDGPGCWASKTVNVIVSPIPTISVSPASATICLGEYATFEASGVFDFTWTPGNTSSPIFTASPLNSTTYTVIGADLNHCTNTATANISVEPCTGISTLAKSIKGISIYPNPSSGIVMIEFGSEIKKQIRVENAIGAMLYSAETTGSKDKLDLSHLAKGVYFIKIESSALSGTHKLIID